KKLVKILAIDGGGVRGLIPSIVLQNLESRLSKGYRLAECFDIIAGNSVGGIIALMLATPDKNGKPKYSADYIRQQFKPFAEKVFSRSLWQKIRSGWGWVDAKYSEEALEESLKAYFDDVKLSETIVNVIVPAYEIEEDKTFFFKTYRAHKEARQDCYLKDLARATSAAPTYFRPAQIKDITQTRTLTLMDGGVSTNNPTLAAAVHAMEMYGRDISLFIVSLGTGTNYGAKTKSIKREDVETSGFIGWASKIVPMMMYAVNAVTDYEMYYVLNFNRPQYYFRLQAILEAKDAEMDNIDPENIKVLEQYAEALIQKYDKELDHIAKVLSGADYLTFPEEKYRLMFH
ncbi:MAG: patatin-like phospholipase family protein, partial [Proteobacteria bacterium]|nr:patatin-like phospholipase family protein [Pseudomonadota bacterium]